MTEIAAVNPPRARAVQRSLVAVALVATVLALGFVCARYLAFPGYADHVSPSVAISAWGYWQGHPIYQLQDGAPRFAILFGPLSYLAGVPAFALLGPSVLASKLTGVAALAVTIMLLAWHFLRGPRAAGIDALLFLTAGLLAFAPWSFFVHGDPIELLLAAIAVVAAARPVAVGVCIGLAAAVKIDAPLYFLPIVLELCLRRGWQALLPLGFAAAAATFWPFLLPGVSAHDYASTLLQMLFGRSHTLAELPRLLTYFAIMALPLTLSMAAATWRMPECRFGLASLATLALAFYPATFPGAGPHHFLPLLPIFAEARRRLSGDKPLAIALLPCIVVAVMIARSTLDWMAERGNWGPLANEAVGLAVNSLGGPAQIGYGDAVPSYEVAQLARAKLAFRGVPPMIDGQVLMDLRESGIDGSRRWIPYVSDCRKLRWVLPRGEQPFALGSYYPGVVPFDDAFRRAFAAHYQPVAASPHFTLWGCGDGDSHAGRRG